MFASMRSARRSNVSRSFDACERKKSNIPFLRILRIGIPAISAPRTSR